MTPTTAAYQFYDAMSLLYTTYESINQSINSSKQLINFYTYIYNLKSQVNSLHDIIGEGDSFQII